MIMEKIIKEIEQIAIDSENGNIKPFQALIHLYTIEKSIQSAVKDAKQVITDKTIEELSMYTKGDEPSYMGLRPTVVTTTRFKCDHDDEYSRLKDLVKLRESAMKKSYARTANNKDPLRDESGEIIPPAEPTSSTYIKMEIVK